MFLTGVLVSDHDGDGKQCPKQPMLRNYAFYLEFKGAINPHVPKVLGWSCGGHWKFLNGVFVPDLDGDRSKMSQMTYILNFSILY